MDRKLAIKTLLAVPLGFDDEKEYLKAKALVLEAVATLTSQKEAEEALLDHYSAVDTPEFREFLQKSKGMTQAEREKLAEEIQNRKKGS